MNENDSRDEASSAVLTIPNAISFLRICLIPVFFALIVDPDTTWIGLWLFAFTVATDWVDGTIARRTHSVSNLGKVLDPLADRLAVAAGLIALMVRDAFPVWAGALILIRDAAILAVWVLLLKRHLRIDVRWLGKSATFSLMVAIVAVAWGNLGYWAAPAALALGWVSYTVGIVEYYWAAAFYLGDVRRALRPV
jgi:cardiolipin synthase